MRDVFLKPSCSANQNRRSPSKLRPSPQLHRRLLYDDYRGVGEPLNETSDIFPEGLVVRGRLLLSLDRPASAADAYRPLGQEVVLQPLLTFTEGDLHPNTELEVREEERPALPLPRPSSGRKHLSWTSSVCSSLGCRLRCPLLSTC